jgi:23S rRNA pseudouridine2605 synthase
MSDDEQESGGTTRERPSRREGRVSRSKREVVSREPVRLQKYLAECGIASRRNAEEEIRMGNIRVNNIVVTELGVKIIPGKDLVHVGRRVVRPAHKGVLLLHKPRAVVSTLSDPEGRPCVGDYLTTHYRSYYPVGRLDFESTGLVVFTNDGDLADRLLHPKFGIVRSYDVRVAGDFTERLVERARKGVMLSDGPAYASIEIVKQAQKYTWLRVHITEGRNRYIRRLMERLGHPVDKLKRIGHGPFRLSTLLPGQIRRLTEEEYRRAREKVFAPRSETQLSSAKIVGGLKKARPRRKNATRWRG